MPHSDSVVQLWPTTEPISALTSGADASYDHGIMDFEILRPSGSFELGSSKSRLDDSAGRDPFCSIQSESRHSSRPSSFSENPHDLEAIGTPELETKDEDAHEFLAVDFD